MTEIKCILFDIGGVLVDWHMSWITSEISNRFELEKSSIDTAFEKHLHELDCGKITEKEFWNKIGNYCSSEKLQETSESLWDTYFRKNAIPNTKLIQLSENIKNNFSTGVLSNIEKVTHSIVEDWNVLDNFEHKFFSYKIGYSKPNSKIYEYVMENLPFSPNEILFIDDKKTNITEAENLGIIGIQFSDNESLEKNLSSLGIIN